MSDTVLASLLDRVDDVFTRYVAFPSDAARYAVVAWVAHCHAVDAFDSTPRLAVLSPEKGSGKTRVMEVIELHVPNPMLTVNVSAAALFRKVAEPGVTTVLLDEADTYLGVRVAKEHEDIRGLVNAGHRRGAKAMRAAIGAKGVKVEEFDAFAPVALAGIGDLPDTIIDRSVVIAMRRRRADETVEPFRWRKAERAAEHLRGELTEWANGAVADLEDVEPDMPPGIVDRPADVWEPLIVIGDAAGEPWSTRIRSAAVELNQLRAERDPSLGIQLLRDCRRVFTAAGVDRLPTEQLVDGLVALDDAPWGDLRGKSLDARGLARRIAKYEVKPRQHRFGDDTRKGYLTEDFHDAWARYLTADPGGSPVANSTPAEPVSVVSVVSVPQPQEGALFRSREKVEGGEVEEIHSETLDLTVPETGKQAKQAERDDLCPVCDERPSSSFAVGGMCAPCSSEMATA
jgi:hypothetical protein